MATYVDCIRDKIAEKAYLKWDVNSKIKDSNKTLHILEDMGEQHEHLKFLNSESVMLQYIKWTHECK